MEIRSAPDKLADTIANKVSRKSNKQTADNVPYSITLINDFKRNSIVFKTESDIYEYTQKLKVCFGEY